VINALKTAWRFIRRGTAAARRGKRYGLLLYIYAFAAIAILIVAFIALAGRAPPLRMMYLLSMGGVGMVALISQILERLHRRRRNRDK
jgi:peptidoglycan/LPS O-acetylase OafA/YrhL